MATKKSTSGSCFVNRGFWEPSRDFAEIPSESMSWNIEHPNPEVARIGIGSKVKFVPAFNATPAGTVAYLIFQARRMSSFQEFLYLCYWFQNTWDS